MAHIKNAFIKSKTVATMRYRNIGSFLNFGFASIMKTVEFAIIVNTVTVIDETKKKYLHN